MKKVFAIWIACVLMIGTLALVACGGKTTIKTIAFTAREISEKCLSSSVAVK